MLKVDVIIPGIIIPAVRIIRELKNAIDQIKCLNADDNRE